MLRIFLKKGLQNLFFWMLVTVGLLMWAKQVFAASGELIMTIRINDLHGGVYTYDSGTTPEVFGLLATGSTVTTFINDFFPSNGIITKTVPEGELEISLECNGLCRNKLDFSDKKAILVKKNIEIEANQKHYLDFVVKPTETGATLALKSTTMTNGSKSELITFAGKMLEKSQKMLDWTLNINDAGFYNQAINNIFKKVISVINGFLIIALLIIAAMWNFAALISTKTLRQMLFVFAFISIIVNFTLPIGRLGIDLAESVQASFLTKSDGNKISANDLIAVDLWTGWEGEGQNSWTQLGLPNQTQWEIIEWPIFYDDFALQNNLKVDLTPKGKGDGYYLSSSDCDPANRTNCASGIDCTILYVPDNCTIGTEYQIATCDNINLNSQWVWMKIKCIKK